MRGIADVPPSQSLGRSLVLSANQIDWASFRAVKSKKMENPDEVPRKLPRPKPKQITRAKKQRNEMLTPELLLWVRLRPKVNKDFRFRRQAPLLGRFTADFYVSRGSLRIVFEIDGKIHQLHRDSDAIRDELFNEAGIFVVRISAQRVLKNPDGVAELIRMICMGEIHPHDLDQSNPFCLFAN